MNAARLLSALSAIAVLSACAAERKPPPRPAPPPVVRSTPAPTSTPAQPPADWRDAAITPGDWTYRAEANGSSALFGPAAAPPLLALRCDRTAAQVALARSGAAPASVPLTVTTSTSTRAFTAAPLAGDPPQVGVTFAPRDPILDAMAFSRGRFVVEVPGLPTLYLPAWPEIGRAIEDCRGQ